MLYRKRSRNAPKTRAFENCAFRFAPFPRSRSPLPTTQVKITPQKDKIQQSSEKYIPRHRINATKIQFPRKQKEKLITPPIPMKDKLQHYKFYGVEDRAVKNEELELKDKVLKC